MSDAFQFGADADEEPLLFGAALHAALAAVGGAHHGSGTLVSRATRAIPLYSGYRLRARWMHDDYGMLRNAAWAVRNSRCGADLNPAALKLVLSEAQQLVEAGEPLVDVLEAFAELLIRP